MVNRQIQRAVFRILFKDQENDLVIEKGRSDWIKYRQLVLGELEKCILQMVTYRNILYLRLYKFLVFEWFIRDISFSICFNTYDVSNNNVFSSYIEFIFNLGILLNFFLQTPLYQITSNWLNIMVI